MTQPQTKTKPSEDVVSETLETLRTFREHAVACVSESNEESAQAVQLVAQRANEIVDLASEHVRSIDAQVQRLRQGESGRGIAEAIEMQSISVQRFLDQLRRELLGQQRLVEQIMISSADIRQISREVEHMASATRIVSLNAMLEATRLGKQGLALSAIAKEMKKLSDRVVSLNQQIDIFLNGMRQTLPELQRGSKVLSEESESFSLDFSNLTGEVLQGRQRLESLLNTAATQGNVCIESIIQRMHQVLAALQFQDPAAQRLQMLEQMIVETEQRLAVLHQAKAAEVSLTWKPNLGTRSIFDGPPPEEDTSDHLSGGDMMLF